MNSQRLKIILFSLVILYAGFSYAEDESRERGLSQLDFDKSTERKPVAKRQDPINEVLSVINNQSQIKETQGAHINENDPSTPKNELGDAPVDAESKNTLHQLD